MLGSGPATGVSTAPPYIGDGRIEPSRMTGPDLNPESVANAAATLKSSSTKITTKGEAVHTAWAGLGASYEEAPEREQLLAVMDPVKADTDDFGGRLKRVSSAIATYADTMAPLQKKLVGLYEEACAFRATIDGGVYVSASDPQNPNYKAVMESSSGAIPDFSHVKATTISWKEHGPSVDTNTRLLGDYASAYASLQNAEADCANAINREVENSCVAPVTKVEAWQLRQPDVKLPWGERVEQKRDCQEGVVYGVGQAGVHLYQGVVSLVAGYNAQKDVYGDWAATGQAWVGLGTLVYGITKIGDPLAWASRLVPDDGPAGLVQQRDLNIAGQDAVINAAKGIVVADRWKDHPAEAFGETLGNVATFFIPGGEVAGGLKTGSIGARVASIGGHAADFLVPAGSLLLKGGTELALRAGEGVRIASESIRVGSGALRGSLSEALAHVGDRLPKYHVTWEPATVGADGTVHPGSLSIDRVESTAADGGGRGGAGSAVEGPASAASPSASGGHSAVDSAPPQYGERVAPHDAAAAPAAPHEAAPPAHDSGPAAGHDTAPTREESAAHAAAPAHDPAAAFDHDASPADAHDSAPAAGHDAAPTHGAPPDHDAASGHGSRMSDEKFLELAQQDPRQAFVLADREQLERGARGFWSEDDADAYGNEHYDDEIHDLSPAHHDALVTYTGPAYDPINKMFQAGDQAAISRSAVVQNIDESLRLHPTDEDIIVTRGTNLNHIKEEPFDQVGVTYDVPSYLSTSLGDTPFVKKDAILHLIVPQGTPSLYLERLTQFPNQRELLLPRGLSYTVERVVIVDGKVHEFGVINPWQ